MQPLIKAFDDADATVKQNAIDGLRAIDSPEAKEFLAAHQISPVRRAAKSADTFAQALSWLGLLILIAIILNFWSLLINTLSHLPIGSRTAASVRPVLEFLAVLVAGVFPNVLGSISHAVNPNYRSRDAAWQQLLGRWEAHFAAAVVVTLIAANQPAGMASVGLHSGPQTNNGDSIFLGLFAFTVVMLAFRIAVNRAGGSRDRGRPANLDLSRPHLARALIFRDCWQCLGHLLELAVGVVAEDLVSRGYLVLYMGHQTGSYIPWIILSLGLTVVEHLYQGRDARTILFHIVAAGAFIALTVYTQNLLAAIAPHILYDVLWTQGIWRWAAAQKILEPEPRRRVLEKLAYGGFIGINLVLLASAVLWVIG